MATQLQLARAKIIQGQPLVHEHKVEEGDLVLIQNCASKTFEPKYKEDYRIIRFLGKNQLEVKDNNGKVMKVHITDVK